VGALAAATLVPLSAQAWWRGGFFIGAPIVVAPPAYYYPPYYAAPYYAPPGYVPPAYYPPAAPAYTPIPQDSQNKASQANAPYGSTCYAGFYVCPAPSSTHVGSGCSCPGLGAPSYGTVR
jgi:hypothetical protein